MIDNRGGFRLHTSDLYSKGDQPRRRAKRAENFRSEAQGSAAHPPLLNARERPARPLKPPWIDNKYI